MATMVDDNVFVDTNVLFHARVTQSPFHQVADEMLTQFVATGNKIWLSRQIFREYLSVMSRLGKFPIAIPIASLTDDIQEFESRFEIAEDGPQVTASLLTLLNTIPTLGKQVHDANIVATMLASGVTKLLTQNVADFQRYSHLITVIPLA